MTIETRDLVNSASRKVPRVEVAPSASEEYSRSSKRLEHRGRQWCRANVKRGKEWIRVRWVWGDMMH